MLLCASGLLAHVGAGGRRPTLKRFQYIPPLPRLGFPIQGQNPCAFGLNAFVPLYAASVEHLASPDRKHDGFLADTAD